jgi:hypothetical protein
LGRNANDGGDDNGTGMTMSETIIFDKALTANEINRVDSYLAIKGGITLNVANTPSYLAVIPLLYGHPETIQDITTISLVLQEIIPLICTKSNHKV